MKNKAYVIMHQVHGLYLGAAGASCHYFSEGISSLEHFPNIPGFTHPMAAQNFMNLTFRTDFMQSCEIVEANHGDTFTIDDLVGTKAEKFVARLIMIRAKEDGVTFH